MERHCTDVWFFFGVQSSVVPTRWEELEQVVSRAWRLKSWMEGKLAQWFFSSLPKSSQWLARASDLLHKHSGICATCCCQSYLCSTSCVDFKEVVRKEVSKDNWLIQGATLQQLWYLTHTHTHSTGGSLRCLSEWGEWGNRGWL